jgi:L-fuculose-phosphate aldolase
MMDETSLREEIIRVTRLVCSQGLARSSDGNVSARLDAERILITPRGLYKMEMALEDLVIIDGEGQLLAGKPGRQPTTEYNLHLEVYRQRPDLQAVLHAHPPYTTALSITGLPFPTDYMPEVLVLLGPVPTAPYARPGTSALGESIRELIRAHDNIVLSHHGTVCAAQTLEQALMALERMEATAHTYFLARALGQPLPLPRAELEELAELGGYRYRSGGGEVS